MGEREQQRPKRRGESWRRREEGGQRTFSINNSTINATFRLFLRLFGNSEQCLESTTTAAHDDGQAHDRRSSGGGSGDLTNGGGAHYDRRRMQCLRPTETFVRRAFLCSRAPAIPHCARPCRAAVLWRALECSFRTSIIERLTAQPSTAGTAASAGAGRAARTTCRITVGPRRCRDGARVSAMSVRRMIPMLARAIA